MLTYEHQQPQLQRPSGPYAANAAPSRNLERAVVAVAEVLGSETAEVWVTQTFTTVGTRVFRYAKHRQNGPTQSLLDKKTSARLMVMT